MRQLVELERQQQRRGDERQVLGPLAPSRRCRGGRAAARPALGRVPDLRRHDLLLPLELYELTHRISPLKLVTLVLNVAVVVYLLLAKRLFGLRGGARAEREERERDMGWPAIERTTPGALPLAT